MRLKNIWGKKSYLWAYLRFCSFLCPLCLCLVVFLCLLFFLCVQNVLVKKKSLKWPDYLIYITTVLTYYINFAASTGCELNHDLHCPSDYLAPKCAKGMLECKKIRKTKEILKEIRNKLLKKKEIKKRTI